MLIVKICGLWIHIYMIVWWFLIKLLCILMNHNVRFHYINYWNFTLFPTKHSIFLWNEYSTWSSLISNFMYNFTISIQHEIQQELCKGNGSCFKTHALFNFNNEWKNLRSTFYVNSIFWIIYTNLFLVFKV